MATVEIDGFTVRRYPQPFAVRQRLFQLKTIFRQRDRRLAGEQPRLALAQAIDVAAKTLRQILGAGVAVVPVGERHAAAHADLDAPAPLLEHFAHQQQRRQRPVDQ